MTDFCNIEEIKGALERQKVAPEHDERTGGHRSVWDDGRFIYTLTFDQDDHGSTQSKCYIRIPTSSLTDNIQIFLHSCWPLTVLKNHVIDSYELKHDEHGLVVCIELKRFPEAASFLSKDHKLINRLGDQIIVLSNSVARIVRVGLIAGHIIRRNNTLPHESTLRKELENQLEGAGLEGFLRQTFKQANVNSNFRWSYCEQNSDSHCTNEEREIVRRYLCDFLISGFKSTRYRNLLEHLIVIRCLEIQFHLLRKFFFAQYEEASIDQQSSTCGRVDRYIFKRPKNIDNNRYRKYGENKHAHHDHESEPEVRIECSLDDQEPVERRLQLPVPNWYQFPKGFHFYKYDKREALIRIRDDKWCPNIDDRIWSIEIGASWIYEDWFTETSLQKELRHIKSIQRWIDPAVLKAE